VWIEQNKQGAAPDQIDASGADALRVQTIIEAAIESWDTGKVIEL
jgi:predicted dehydrogenase